MFDFVRGIIAEGDVYAIRVVINEMKGLIEKAEERIRKIENGEADEEDYDRCYECKGYGDDYSTDENGELVCNCDNCPYCINSDDND